MLKKILVTIVLTTGCCFIADISRERSAVNQVLRVVDGDTVYGFVEGRSQRLRFLGIETPETVHPRKPIEKWGPEASAFTKEFILKHDEVITFIYLKNGKVKRGYRKRPLIWISCDCHGQVLNVELVRAGLAYFKTYGNKNLKYESELREAVKEARGNRVGIWSK